MPGFDLLTPWIGFGLALAALVFVQRWIQRHLFGMGWIVAQEKHLATVVYYMVLLPGVFVHEVSHWLVAGMLNVKTRRLMTWPEADHNGAIEPAFIQVEETSNPIYLTLIGAAPFVSGLLLVLWISNSLLNLPILIKALGSADVTVISAAFQAVLTRPDFPLWFYLLFAVSNSMLPGKADRRGWLVIAALVVGVFIFLIVTGFQAVVIKWLGGPIAQALNSLSAVFLTVLVIDCIVAAGIFVLERGMERVTHRQAPYREQAAASRALQNKSRAAAPRLTSIYQYRLPLPAAPRHEARSAMTARPAVGALPKPPASPAPGGFGAPRPTLSAPSSATESPRLTPSSAPAIRPTFTPPARPDAARPETPAIKPAEPIGTPTPPPARTLPPLTPNTPSGIPSRPAIPASVPTSSPTGTPAIRPGLPVPGGARPAAPLPSRPPGFAPAAKNVPQNDPKNDDYIDADVIEDDEPGFMRGVGNSRPVPNPSASTSADRKNDSPDDDSGEVKYVNLDDSA